MFLVVMTHVETFGLGIGAYSTAVGNTLISFRMPMFFFISGYIAYKATMEWNIGTFTSLLSKKARIQLIPTVVFFSLFCVTRSSNPITAFLEGGWGGYWFTFVLFEMYVVFYCLSLFLKKYSVLCMMALGVMGVVLLQPLRSDASWWTLLCMENLCKYFQFFALLPRNTTWPLCRL